MQHTTKFLQRIPIPVLRTSVPSLRAPNISFMNLSGSSSSVRFSSSSSSSSSIVSSTATSPSSSPSSTSYTMHTLPTDNPTVSSFTGTASSTGSGSNTTTHFGYKTVDERDKAKLVEEVFRNVANTYDTMNDFMSAGLHRLWKDEFIRMAEPLGATGGKDQIVLLDVAGGTGDIAFRLVDSLRRGVRRPAPRPKVIVCDINASMLAVGEERAKKLGYASASSPSSPSPTASSSSSSSPPTTDDAELVWLQGDAEMLKDIPDNSVDLYTIAFGIRNVTHVDKALQQAYRVLKPGGRFMCLEFSQVNVPGIAQIYDLYSFNVIPALGQIVANDRPSYQYLVESIRKFPDQNTFAAMMEDAGFQHVRYTNFTFGVCAVHTGFKLRKLNT